MSRFIARRSRRAGISCAVAGVRECEFAFYQGCCVFQAGLDILKGKARVISEQVLQIRIAGQLCQHELDRDTSPSNCWFAYENGRVADNAVISPGLSGRHAASEALSPLRLSRNRS